MAEEGLAADALTSQPQRVGFPLKLGLASPKLANEILGA